MSPRPPNAHQPAQYLHRDPSPTQNSNPPDHPPTMLIYVLLMIFFFLIYSLDWEEYAPPSVVEDPQPKDPQPKDPQPKDPQPKDPQPKDPPTPSTLTFALLVEGPSPDRSILVEAALAAAKVYQERGYFTLLRASEDGILARVLGSGGEEEEGGKETNS